MSPPVPALFDPWNLVPTGDVSITLNTGAASNRGPILYWEDPAMIPVTFDWQASAAHDTSWRGKSRQWIVSRTPDQAQTLTGTKVQALFWTTEEEHRADANTVEESVDELTLWQEDPPARTFPWLDAVADWMEQGADCSGTSVALLVRSLPTGFSGRTLLVPSAATTARTSAPCCGDLLGSGQMCPRTGGAPEECASALTEQRSGGCLTLATTEWPSGAVECSLSQVLEASVGPKYYLSSQACAGILRRAEARGKKLPARLEAALAAVAGPPTPTA